MESKVFVDFDIKGLACISSQLETSRKANCLFLFAIKD